MASSNIQRLRSAHVLEICVKQLWKSMEMSFMTGLELRKSETVKADGELEENLTVCIGTHQHGGQKSVDNGYSTF